MFPKANYLEMPYTVDDAANRLMADLDLRDRIRMADMDEAQVRLLHTRVGKTIVNEFRLWEGNDKLLQSCIMAPEMDAGGINDPSMVIVMRMWRRLRRTHRLRLVK